MGSAGLFLSTIGKRAHEKADREREQFQKDRDGQLNMYRSAFDTAMKSGDMGAAQAAAKELDKLMGTKEKVYGGLIGKLQEWRDRGQQMKQAQAGQMPAQASQQGQPGQPMDEKIPGVGGTSAMPGPAQPQPGGQPGGQSQPQQAPQRSLPGRIVSGAGRVAGAMAGAMAPGHQPSLPPINTAAFHAGKTPEQQAKFDREQRSQDTISGMIDYSKGMEALGMSPEDARHAAQQHYGSGGKGTWASVPGTKPYQKADGKWYVSMKHSSTGEVVEQAMPDGFKPAEGKTSKDDRYLGILTKERMGQQLTAEDKAYRDAYRVFTNETKVAPGVARAVAFGANRYVPVIDPNDPEKVVLMTAGEAARASVGTPASIAFQTDRAITRAFTSGNAATNLNYFNTATDHLEMLKKAADALNNGDVQAANELGNAWARATGDPAPTNFGAVRTAVAGELSKTFKGTGATDQEIKAVQADIDAKESPAQLAGAINQYTMLMRGKVNALQHQYEAGKQGKPAFPQSLPPLNGGGGAAKPKAPAVGTVQDGYRFKGGDPANQSSWEKVK